MGSDAHPPDAHDVSVDPVAGEVDLGLDGGALADGEHPRDRRHGVQVDVAADLGSQGAGVVAHPRGTGESHRSDLVGDLVGQPHAHVHRSTAGVVARLDSGEQHPCSGDSDGHAPERRDEHEDADDQQPERHDREVREVLADPGEDLRGREEVEQPAHATQNEQRHADDGLQPLGRTRSRGGFAEARGTHVAGLGAHPGVEFGRHGTEPRIVVDVGDGEFRVALADACHQLRGRERPAAEVEEAGIGSGCRNSEHGQPVRGEPTRRRIHVVDDRLRSQRPGQRRLVDLARGSGGKLVDHGEQGHEGGGELFGEPSTGRALVEGCAIGHGDVADEHLVARIGPAHGDRGTGDAGKSLDRGLDLAELDAATSHLHLVVGSTLEDQAGAVELHQVSAAVGAIPAQAGERGVLLGVLRGVEVAGEPHSPDDEFAHLAVGDRAAIGIDHGERPAVEWEADAHGNRAVEEGGAGDDRGLGRPVGVPDLALG